MKFWKLIGRVQRCCCVALVAAGAAASGIDVSAQETGQPASQEMAARSTAVAPRSLTGAELVRLLTSRDASERLRAAEDLAQMAAPEHRRMVEGYRLQEKNGRVRVALDWALYRMGKREALFQLVRALDTSRSDQAEVYLSALEVPEELYSFLDPSNGRTQVKLLQVLGHIGDAGTLERIKPFNASLDPLVGEAAKAATDEITARLAQSPSDGSEKTPSRPRQTGRTDDDEAPAEETSP